MKTFFKWTGIGVAGLAVCALVFLAGAFYVSNGRWAEQHDVPARIVVASMDSAAVERGHRLAVTHGCTSCHGGDLSGTVFDIPPGRLVASNLTAGEGGVGARYTPEDWDRAIRHGVRADGRALVGMMPSATYHNLADADMADLLAYLQQVEPVDNTLPPTELKLLGRVISTVDADNFYSVRRIDHDREHPTRPSEPATVEFGAYRARTVCIDCHGADLRGGVHPDPSIPLAAPDLAAAGQWSLDDFIRTMRTGTAPSGKQLDPVAMPYEYFAPMSDEELTGIHMHLATLAEAPVHTAAGD